MLTLCYFGHLNVGHCFGPPWRNNIVVDNSLQYFRSEIMEYIIYIYGLGQGFRASGL